MEPGADRHFDQEKGEYKGFFAPPQPFDNTQEAIIVYTSGTTGAPKGVLLNQYNLLVDAQGRLDADGCSLGELRAAAEAGRLALLPIERLLARRRRHSMLDAGFAAGLSDAFTERNHRALGLPLPDPGEPVYDDDHVENLRTLRGMLDAGDTAREVRE